MTRTPPTAWITVPKRVVPHLLVGLSATHGIRGPIPCEQEPELLSSLVVNFSAVTGDNSRLAFCLGNFGFFPENLFFREAS
ncbi:hypothetical protein K1719_023250 [Acacia pycnantha]|nr:hypothetical protein K1719_023250 [Acacia pycnantha]